MKRILLTLIFSTLVVAPPAFSKTKTAEITKSVNFTQVSHGKKRGRRVKKWKRTTKGADLFAGDYVRTGLRSGVEIKYIDGSMTRVGSRSIVRVKNSRLKLKKGYIWGKVTKRKSRNIFKIFTASAVCAILGTEFFVEVEDGDTVLTVLSGVIEFSGSKGKVKVEKGQKAIIEADGSVGNVTGFDVNEVVSRYAEVVNMK